MNDWRSDPYIRRRPRPQALDASEQKLADDYLRRMEAELLAIAGTQDQSQTFACKIPKRDRR